MIYIQNNPSLSYIGLCFTPTALIIHLDLLAQRNFKLTHRKKFCLERIALANLSELCLLYEVTMTI